MPNKYSWIIIEDEATVCPGSIILPGVRIGKKAIVAPGSIVNRDVPDGVIVAGAPAKKILLLSDALNNIQPKVTYWIDMDKKTRYPWECKNVPTDKIL